MKIRGYLAIACLLICASYQNCGKDSFSSVAQDSSVGVDSVPDSGITPTAPTTSTQSCTIVGNTNTTDLNLKILFMVDNSGSTNTTDPQKKYRVLAVQNFITTYGATNTFSYGYGFFQDTSSWIYDTSTALWDTSPQAPIGNVTDLGDALTAFQLVKSGNNTPYKAAFTLLDNAITADEAANPTSTSNYAVVFMSDGMPTDINGDVPTGIMSLVNNLISTAKLGGKLLSVSAVYFGPENSATAISNLQGMAKDGGGQFVDTNKTTNLDFASIITIPGSTCTAGASSD